MDSSNTTFAVLSSVYAPMLTHTVLNAHIMQLCSSSILYLLLQRISIRRCAWAASPPSPSAGSKQDRVRKSLEPREQERPVTLSRATTPEKVIHMDPCNLLHGPIFEGREDETGAAGSAKASNGGPRGEAAGAWSGFWSPREAAALGCSSSRS